MKQGSKYILKSDVPAWLHELAASWRVIAPRPEGSAVVYREYDREKDLELGRKATESAKHVLFPRGEELFSFCRIRPPLGIQKLGDTEHPDGAEEPTAPVLKIREPEDPAPTLVFGLLGCDAGGVSTFDPVYGGARFPDKYYLRRREATVLIVKACNELLSTCFCRWVGGDPADRRHADILATELADGFLLEPLTGRAASVLTSRLLKDAQESQADDAQALHNAARDAMGDVPDLSGAEAALQACFDDQDFWWRHSAGCIACGACTYLCPTCHCFTIADEAAGHGGVRLRAWDTCMAALYTLEASGHNPRPQKTARLRNRVGHKFSYFPRNNKGVISCCGCGRCIKSCPSSVDIRRIVLDAVACAASAKEAANA